METENYTSNAWRTGGEEKDKKEKKGGSLVISVTFCFGLGCVRGNTGNVERRQWKYNHFDICHILLENSTLDDLSSDR